MSPQPWANGCAGAVSLTFDDGHSSQLETAIPILNELGLRGTFYVNPPQASVEWLRPWRDAHGQGHEIGNHTISHVCSRNFGFRDDARGLEDLTLADVEADIVECSRRLREGVPEQREFTFCYPCYQTFVGEGARRQSYVPLVARHFIAARGRGERANHPKHADLHELWSFPCERMSGAELVGLAENAAAQGRWAILTFHGVGTGHLPIGESDITELCEFLGRHRDRVWTAPLVDVAQAAAAWRDRGR